VHKDDTKCKHCGRSRYVKVINEDGASVTIKMVIKQLRYIPITPNLKRLFLYEETAQQMRWHEEGIGDSEDVDIMSHLVDVEAWHALNCFDPKFARDPGVSILIYQQMIFNLIAPIVLRTLASQFS
jgi:hypothetical protein